MIVNPVANRNRKLPSLRDRSKQIGGNLSHPIDFAITAAEKKLKHLVGKLLHWILQRFVADRVGLIFNPHKTAACHPKSAIWRTKSQTAIPETIEIDAALNLPLGVEIDVFDV